MRIVKMSEIQDFPGFKTLSPEELAQAYALAKAAFTAEDLQRFTETDLDQGIPMEVLLQEMEEVQRQMDQRTA
jgi:methanogenic corrinoid protein MtbC1